MMQAGLGKIVGKTISHVVVGAADHGSREIVYLVFQDGTAFEFYGSDFSCASGLDRGGVSKVVTNMQKGGSRVYQVYGGEFDLFDWVGERVVKLWAKVGPFLRRLFGRSGSVG
jgi:hypothetical protein